MILIKVGKLVGINSFDGQIYENLGFCPSA